MCLNASIAGDVTRPHLQTPPPLGQSLLQEWITPQPSRRPDIFPEFEKLETPLPKPLPGDPEVSRSRSSGMPRTSVALSGVHVQHEKEKCKL
jgi:hypothetical protein